MVASREKQHNERIPKSDKYKMGILPIAAIYGGNASGKTKLFNALAFAKKFVVKITQPGNTIPREYFKLDNECVNKPSRFLFELLINEICYEFSFSVTQSQVVEEKLIVISKSTEKTLYNRSQDKKIEFDKNSEFKNDQRLQFVAEGTRENQLFLTASVDQKIPYFQPIYDWFKNNLTLITPNTTFAEFGQFTQEGMPLYSLMNNALLQLDTGITRLGGEDIPMENLLLPDNFKTKLMEDLPENESIINFQHRIILTKKNGTLSARKLVSYHQSFEKSDVPFDINQESAGTLRMIDILPCFFELFEHNTPKVCVIDELDRCLHTLLTRSLLEAYFNSCSKETRSQLLFTTHDALLIDQKLFRRDEIWVTERNNRGCTSLISFGEYKKIRFDKDIRKSYLQGHLGGIPKIHPLALQVKDK